MADAASPLRISVTVSGSEAIVGVRGPVFARSARSLAGTLVGLATESVTSIVVDLLELATIDGPGLSILVAAFEQVQQCGSSARLCSVPVETRRLLEANGLTQWL